VIANQNFLLCQVVTSLTELLGLLESFDEEFAPLLSIELQEVGVEVGSVRGQRLVTPLTHALIIYIANEPFV